MTLDADLHEYSILQSGPPLIIWLKCGWLITKYINRRGETGPENAEQWAKIKDKLQYLER